jgi:hypothetical protein
MAKLSSGDLLKEEQFPYPLGSLFIRDPLHVHISHTTSFLLLFSLVSDIFSITTTFYVILLLSCRMAQDKAVVAISKFLNGIDVSTTLNVEYYMLIICRSPLRTHNRRTIVIVRVTTMGKSLLLTLRRPTPNRSQYQRG